MKPRRLLARLARGDLQNVSFDDARRLVEALGFEEILNMQDVRGEAKPYQLRQLLRLVERYGLRLEEDA